MPDDPNFQVSAGATKLLAAVLFIFSGFWPHFKLFMVQVLWYMPVPRGKSGLRHKVIPFPTYPPSMHDQ